MVISWPAEEDRAWAMPPQLRGVDQHPKKSPPTVLEKSDMSPVPAHIIPHQPMKRTLRGVSRKAMAIVLVA